MPFLANIKQLFQGDNAVSKDMLPTTPIRRTILNVKAVSFLLLFSVLTLMAAVPTPLNTQLMFAVAASIFLTIAVVTKSTGALRSLIVVVIFFCSARYIIWRMTETLIWYDPWALGFGLALLSAEIYGVIILGLNLFVNASPKTRDRASLPVDPATWPSVDVFIATYNEAPELVEATMMAAKSINYPADKLNVYVLDDGGTAERLNAKDTELAQSSYARAKRLQDFCKALNVHYLTRDDNTKAKAGNINAALPRTSGELILFLDADHAPTADFLERTVGYFIQNPKLFLVQTPHFFINPDPLERNLGTFNDMPSENEMFYSTIQRGLDSWGATFFCGSAGVLRREALESIGGFSDETITEDVETSLELHARGWESLYVSDPLIAGLSPETLTGFVVQRTRWAQGMIQMFLLKNPIFRSGLTLSQRICYVSSSLFWFFPLARIIFTMAPIAFYLFGVNIFDATQGEFLAYGIPHFFGTVLISIMLFGNVRWLFVSEIYELLQSTYGLRAIGKVLISPRAPKFNVTPKAETLKEDFISPIAWPFYLLTILLIGAEISGIRQLLMPGAEREMSAIILFWNTFHLILMLFVLGIVFERKQARRWPRMPKRLPMTLEIGDNQYPVRLADCSLLGARLKTSNIIDPLIKAGAEGVLAIRSIYYDTTHTIPIKLKRTESNERGEHTALGVEYNIQTDSDKIFAASLLYANSYDWDDFRDSRAQRGHYFQKTLFLFRKGATRAFAHVAALFGVKHI